MPSEPLLSVRGIGKRFADAGGPWAVRGVTFDLARGRTLGLVGPSGSGKSTLARCLALQERPTSGSVALDGRNVWEADRLERRRLCAEIQMIWQQPASTLNPRFTAEQIVREPLDIQRRGTEASRRKRALELMELAGLRASAAARPALESSGGERQRLAIARALALDPKLLILDESLTGLDLSIQAQILRLLLELQTRLGLTYILISHDLGLVSGIADEIAMMDAGEMVERGPAAALIANPQHPRTREVLNAALALDGGAA
jgi:peptide/nickel transport system ATP-binding protein